MAIPLRVSIVGGWYHCMHRGIERRSNFADERDYPSGAPAPIFKTLDEIEPRTPITSIPFPIVSSGSYYITSNFTGVAG